MLLILSGPFSIAILVGGCEHCLFCPYIGNNTTNWRTHIFQRSWKHQPVLCWITGWGMSSIIPSIVVVYIPIGFGFPKMGWMTKRPHHLLTMHDAYGVKTRGPPWTQNQCLTGWWFGTWLWLLYFHILGIATPTDFHIFQRDWNHQPA